jgi:hypothetical protein
MSDPENKVGEQASGIQSQKSIETKDMMQNR